MVAKNDITGDSIQSRANNRAFADQWEKIYGKVDNTAEGLIRQMDKTDQQASPQKETQPRPNNHYSSKDAGT